MKTFNVGRPRPKTDGNWLFCIQQQWNEPTNGRQALLLQSNEAKWNGN